MPMTACPNPRQLRRLLEEQLEPADESRIVAHVENCAKCQQRLDGLTERSLTHPSWIPPLEDLELPGWSPAPRDERAEDDPGPNVAPPPTPAARQDIRVDPD